MARILITGTSKGIGYEATLLLARAGHEVIATMRNPGASDLGKVTTEEKLPVTVLPMDVDDDASVSSVFQEQGASIDVLVNNAGIYSINAVEDESLDQFRRVIETNYLGAVRCVKEVLPAMRERRAGCIVNVTSIAGRIAFGSTSAYNASKFALEGFTEALAQEVSGHGVKVALVEPGIIDTPMATTHLPQFDSETIYPHGRRIHAFFHNPEKPEASPALVGEMIRHVIESDDPRLRFPVGPDAHPFLGWRSSLSDEDWVGLGRFESDADYFQRVFVDTGVDLRTG
ncbi:MAG: SDR family oxidoreductase [Myxococcota bacterium]|nr:SDR family oxidoreductase [Myxococcota bacterium]